MPFENRNCLLAKNLQRRIIDRVHFLEMNRSREIWIVAEIFVQDKDNLFNVFEVYEDFQTFPEAMAQSANHFAIDIFVTIEITLGGMHHRSCIHSHGPMIPRIEDRET